MGKNKYFSEDLRQKIVDLHKSGKTQIEIANNLKISKSAVSKIIKKFKTFKTIKTSLKLDEPEKRTHMLIK